MVKFESGRIAALKLELNGVFCIIRTQNVIKSAIDGVFAVESEEVCNTMNLFMRALTPELFLNIHLSYCTENVPEVLDSCRTKLMCGDFLKHPDKVRRTDRRPQGLHRSVLRLN